MINLASSAFAAFVAAFAFAVPAQAEIANGTMIPNLTVTDSNGVQHNLHDFNGQRVVLEWFNHGCPYVQKHYETGNMQALQTDALDDGAVWLTVVSSAEGEQGYTKPAEANEIAMNWESTRTATILDPSGAVGKAFGAKTTPHMYVIDEEGMLRYQGAIDDNSSARHDTVEGAKNYVRNAMAALDAGAEPDPAQTRAYGCSVKYAKDVM